MPRLAVLLLVALAAARPPCAAAAEPQDVFTFLLKSGSFGSGPGQLAFPLGIATDAAGRVYVADTETNPAFPPATSNHRIQIFNPDGTVAGSIGRHGAGDGEFEYPVGVAVDGRGWILVADSGNNRLQLFDPARQFVQSFGTYGNYDTSPWAIENRDPLTGDYIGPAPTLTGLNFPTRVALRPGTRLHDPDDADGRIAILDLGNHRVVMLDAMLRPLFAFGSFGTDGNALGNFEYPFGVAMDLTRIYVADPQNHRIQMFDQSGQPLSAFGSVGAANAPDDLQNPYDVQPDGQGRLVVVDTDRSRVLLLTANQDTAQTPRCADTNAADEAGRCAIHATDGTWYDARVIGRPGSGDGEFSYPQAAAIVPGGRLAIVDSDNHRYQVFARAHLRVADVSIAETGSVPSGGAVHVGVTVINDGDVPLDVTPGLAASLGGRMRVATADTIAPGQSRAFAFVFTTNITGSLSFTASAVGRPIAGNTIAAPPVTTSDLTVTPGSGPKIGVVLSAPPVAGVNALIPVTVTVTNTGDVPLATVVPAIAADPFQLAAVQASLTTLGGSLAPGASQTFPMAVSAVRAGDVTLRASASAAYADGLRAAAGAVSTPVDEQPSATVRISEDVVPPRTTIQVSPEPAPSGWFRSPVQVLLTATDNLSVVAVNYKVAALLPQAARIAGSTASLVLSSQGGSDLLYWAEDSSAIAEAKHAMHFDIDTVAPRISAGGVSPAANAAGWNNSAPTVRFLASDGESGVAFVTPDVTVTANGAGQVVKGVARDFAGNESDAQVVVNVDTLKPSLQCTPSRLPNANGWFGGQGAEADVTITCVASDQAVLSGMSALVASCASGNQQSGRGPADGVWTASCTYSMEGVHTFLAEATDNAGNVSRVTFAVRLDKTPPAVACGTVSLGEIWPPNHKLIPWNTSVTVVDNLSGANGFTLAAFSSSEDANTLRDGNTGVDMFGWTLNTPDTAGFIRSERSGAGTGRFYQLRYVGADLAGNTTSCVSAITSLPHDQSGKN